MAKQAVAPRTSWHRHFFYRRESWKTTWKLRFLVLGLCIVIVTTTRSLWEPRLAYSLVCPAETPQSDALLLENFDPDYLIFERAEALERAGIASQAFVPAGAEEGEPNAVEKGTVELMARIARLPHFEIIPIRPVEPISLNAAVQIRDALAKKQIGSVIVISPGFRSRRSALVYSTVLKAAGIRVSCDPVFGTTTPLNWTETWHGIQGLVEQFVKLQYYRFWVLL